MSSCALSTGMFAVREIMETTGGHNEIFGQEPKLGDRIISKRHLEEILNISGNEKHRWAFKGIPISILM